MEARKGTNEAIRESVREEYGKRAATAAPAGPEAARMAEAIGYAPEEAKELEKEGILSLGCGNPTAIASMKPGEVVVDLGSGGGFDAILAARKVGPAGRVIGVDMTDEMLEKARGNARRSGLRNIEFRKGLIEKLPVEDSTADVVMSNCVINLSPEKERVWGEIRRVLKPGGRVMISDTAVNEAFTPDMLEKVAAYMGCIRTAAVKDEYLRLIRNAGFANLRVVSDTGADSYVPLDGPEATEAKKRWGVTDAEVTSVLANIRSVSLFATRE